MLYVVVSVHVVLNTQSRPISRAGKGAILCKDRGFSFSSAISTCEIFESSVSSFLKETVRSRVRSTSDCEFRGLGSNLHAAAY